MVNAICTEIVLRKSEIKEPLETIYFGGGTPSVLSKLHLEKIFRVIYDSYLINEKVEITLEANPDDLFEEKLKELKEAGINRLSIGIQSFREEDLIWMNRSHSANQSILCVQNAQRIGFSNITIDLIYGIPNLSASDWEKNLMQAVKLNPQHISAYCLTIEKKTVFGHRFKNGEIKPIDEDQASEQFLFMRDFLSKNGYFQYEVSNFSNPGFQSKHNTSYWEGKKYSGFGPSAHSYDGSTRRWNVSNNMNYMKGIEEGLDYFEEEILTESNRINETIMISLRMVKGLDLELFEKNFGKEKLKLLLDQSQKHQINQYLITNNQFLQATPQGLLMIDAICADLFL
jgi:oxygen-independent coproporphyrinogen-3 oxidase